MSRSHKPSTYKPQWKGPIEGYAVNYITLNLWRVQASCEHADLLQDAWLVYDRCAKKYPDMDTPQHFMALFKRALANHVNDLANRDSATRALIVPITERKDEEGADIELREHVGEMDNDGMLRVIVRQAPAEVMLVLQLFLNAPAELVEMALSSWNPDSNRRNQGSERLNRLLGLPTDFDSVGTVRAYFSPETAAPIH